MKKRLFLLGALLPTLCPNALALEARVFIRPTCIVTGAPTQPKEMGAIAAAFLANVAGSLVSTGMDALAAALGNEVVTTVKAAARGDYWYVKGPDGLKMSPDIGCIIAVISEEMNMTADPVTGGALEMFEMGLAGIQKDGTPPNLRLREYSKELAELGLTKAPILYFEAKFAGTNVAPVFALDPTLIYYPKFIGAKPWLGKNLRDIAIGLDFSLVGGNFASALLSFEGVAEGELNSKRVASTVLPWVSMPPAEGVLAGKDKGHPFNVRITFTETAKPGVIGKALSGAVSSQKEAVKEAVENKVKLAVSASERQATRNSATTAANTALLSYFEAYAAWKAAQDGWAAVPAADTAEKSKADLLLSIRKSMLDNSEAVAKETMENAGISFTPIK